MDMAVSDAEIQGAPRGQQLDTWRCNRCGRILAKMRLGAGSFVQIRCGCNTFSEREVVESPPPS